MRSSPAIERGAIGPLVTLTADISYFLPFFVISFFFFFWSLSFTFSVSDIRFTKYRSCVSFFFFPFDLLDDIIAFSFGCVGFDFPELV